MILKRSLFLSPSSSCVHSFYSPQCSTTSSQRSTRHSSRRPCNRSAYATISHDGPQSEENHNNRGHAWPEVTSPRKTPTPYEIFGLQKTAPYSKHRFYELVKLYHPDHTHNSYDSNSPNPRLTISESTRLERYRLIVCAHNILSDPLKRRAYDRYGAGWDGEPELHRADFDRRPSRNSPFSNDPMHNATWEDWERWYAREAASTSDTTTSPPPPQTPVYISNLSFLILIMMLAGLGGVGQATRAEGFSETFMEQRDRAHDQASKELRRVRREAKERPREERVERFLEDRDPGWGEREAEARRVLSVAEVCASGFVKEKGREGGQILRGVRGGRRPEDGREGRGED